MFHYARRPVAAIALCLVLAPSLAGCMTVQRVPFSPTDSLGQISGVTTRSGNEIPFAARGASITNDTLYGVGRQGQVIVPTDSVADVWKSKASPARTTALVLGVTAGLVGIAWIAAAIAFSNSFKFGP